MKKLKYPLIVSDFDGTLLRSDERIADETISAIKAYQNAGGNFALCTGRTLASALPIVRGLGLTGLVACFQGSVVADIESGELVVDGYMERSGAVAVCRAIEEMGLHFHVYDTDEYYSNMDDAWLKHYERIVGVKAVLKEDEPLSAFVDKGAIKVRKILILLPPEERERVYNCLCTEFGEEYYVTYSAAFLVEITNRAYSKATALEKIAQYYSVLPEDTIAVGDSLNDLPMIERAGLGIAVGNAEAALKSKANVALAYSNDEDAIGEIIRRYTGLEA
ncbi:MAG: HAD family phosphatase [Clostridiales bacterium]|nr:HAD family phosphatase [Clostridiales bacterium]